MSRAVRRKYKERKGKYLGYKEEILLSKVREEAHYPYTRKIKCRLRPF